MKETIRNLLLASCFLFAISYDSCTLGVDYDKKYRLLPEIDSYSCTLTIVYGKRWERFGFVTFWVATSLIVSAFIVQRREQQSKVKSILNLDEEK